MFDTSTIFWGVVGLVIVVVVLTRAKDYLAFTIFFEAGALLVICYQEITGIVKTVEDTNVFLLVGVLVIIVGGIGLRLRIDSDTNKQDKQLYNAVYPDKKLLPKRERDLVEIGHMVNHFPILGIEAEWGVGKSVFVDKLIVAKQKEGYQIINIDALRFSSEKLSSVVLTELQNIAWRYKEMQTNIYGVLGEVDFPWLLKSIIRFWGISTSPSVRLEKFSEALNKVDKPILINYEDIDRITDVDALRQLLALNELLVRKIPKLKIIYQYSPRKLAELGLGIEYLKKYIPQTKSLSTLGFEEVLEQVLEGHPHIKENLGAEFRALRTHVTTVTPRSYKEQKLWELHISVPRILPFIYPYRQVEEFVLECETVILENPKYEGKKKEIGLNVLFLKHLLPHLYSLLSAMGPGVNKCQDFLKYTISEDKTLLSLDDLMDRGSIIWSGLDKSLSTEEFYREVEKVLKIDKNRDIFNVLSFMGYSQSGFKATEYEIMSDEEIDRVVCNIVQPAVSVRTNDENIYYKLVDIFNRNKTVKENCKSINKLVSELYFADEEKGENTTVILMGENHYTGFFRSISRLLKRRSELENPGLRYSLLECFEWYLETDKNLKNKKSIILHTFSNYTARNDDEVIFIIKLFSQFCKDKLLFQALFQSFVESMLRNIAITGFTDVWVNELLDNVLKHSKEKIHTLEEIKSALISTKQSVEREKHSFKGVYSEKSIQLEKKFDIVLMFLSDCVEIIEHNKFGGDNESWINSNASTVYRKDVKDLIALVEIQGWGKAKVEVEKKYNEGVINLYDLRVLKDLSVKHDKD